MNKIFMPVDRLSYSSVLTLLRNPSMFKKKYILRYNDDLSSVPMMIGKAAHAALEYKYTRDNVHIEDAIKHGMDYLIASHDGFIKYGSKWASREQMLAGYNKVIRNYFKEEPKYHKIIAVEEKWERHCSTIWGDKLPITFTGRVDMVHQYSDNPEDVEIIDTKFTDRFTDYDAEDYGKILQAMFMYHLLYAVHGIKAKRMLFRQTKISENRDGSPQVQDYVIPFDHEPYFHFFYNIIKDVVRFLQNDPVFLPNIADMMDGAESGLIYAQGLMAADLTDVDVLHKIDGVEITHKKFIPSKADSSPQGELSPEQKIELKLAEFGIPVKYVEKMQGAQVTQYRFKVAAGVKMQNIKKMRDDLELALESDGKVSILAPVTGTSLVGVEVPNKERSRVYYDRNKFVAGRAGTLEFAVGQAIDGTDYFFDLAKMPHLLIAGSTGSGKSVLLNTLIDQITTQCTAAELQMLLIDPKRVELAHFEDLPHVVSNKAITEHREAILALYDVLLRMEQRYTAFKAAKVKDIEAYNAVSDFKFPRFVVVVDEYADLMLAEKQKRNKKQKEAEIELPQAETLIARLAAMGRAAGIHIIIATQRPSSDVVTGLIKANFPTRIALTTSGQVDSRVILDETGAEKLTGRGDMLFKAPSLHGLMRLQGYSLKD